MSNIKWVQWVGKTSKELKAFAIDVDAPLKNGILRSINGSKVPAGAVDAQPGTIRDWFCAQILATENGEPRKAKAPKAAKTPKAPKGLIKWPDPHVKLVRDTANVIVEGSVIATFPTSKLVKDAPIDLRISDKTWGIYQNKKRITMGKRG